MLGLPHHFLMWLSKLTKSFHAFIASPLCRLLSHFRFFPLFIHCHSHDNLRASVFIFSENKSELKCWWLFDTGWAQLTKPCMFLSSCYLALLPLPCFPFSHQCTCHAAFCSLLLMYLAWFWLQAFVNADPFTLHTFPFLSVLTSLPAKVSSQMLM